MSRSMARSMYTFSAATMLSSAHEIHGVHLPPTLMPHPLAWASVPHFRHRRVSAKLVKTVGLLPCPCWTPKVAGEGSDVQSAELDVHAHIQMASDQTVGLGFAQGAPGHRGMNFLELALIKRFKTTTFAHTAGRPNSRPELAIVCTAAWASAA